MKNKVIIAIIIILSLVIITGVTILLWSSFAPTNHIMITDISANDDSINIHGTFSDSALVYKGYTTKYSNGELSLRIKYGPISLSKNKEIDISIIKQDYKDVSKIYLVGKESSDNTLIWQK